MEQKKKLKWMVVLEGGQQFLTKFLNKKKLGDFPDTKNYPMEINENAKINPQDVNNGNLQVLDGMVNSVRYKLEEYIPNEEERNPFDEYSKLLLEMIIEAEKQSPSEEKILDLLKKIKAFQLE